MAEFIDNTPNVLDALESNAARALEIIGGKAETYAKQRTPVQTGALRNSITHAVDKKEKTVSIGTNIEYAPYVELGTGKHYQPSEEWIESHGKKGRGLDTWFYMGDDGEWHVGFPQKPKLFLTSAVKDHIDEYKRIVERELKGSSVQ